MRLTLVLCAALLLAGCIFTEYVFTVNEDNSVDFSYITAMSKEYYTDEFAESVQEDSVRNTEYGMVIKSYEDEQTKGTLREKHFDKIADLNDFPLLTDSTKTESQPMVTEEKKADHSLYTISYRPKILTGGDEDFEENEMAAMVVQMLENKVTWKVPFEVVSTNATTKNDSLGVYTWEFKGVEGDSIYLQYKVPNSAAGSGKGSRFVPWIVVALAVLSTLLWLPNWKKQRAQKAEQTTQEPDMQAQDAAQGEDHFPEETKTTPPEEQE